MIPRSRQFIAILLGLLALNLVISFVTSGPAAATRNSTPGESASLPSFATPPNIHRSIPSIGMPLRMATHACPSSCSRIERKNSSALITASANAFEPGATSS